LYCIFQGGQGQRTSTCEDPTDWVIRSYPWPAAASAGLYHLRAAENNVNSQEASSSTSLLEQSPLTDNNTQNTEINDSSKDSLVGSVNIYQSPI